MPTIYLKETGDALECHSIDAREILDASPDLYSATAPEPEPPVAAVVASLETPVSEPTVAEPDFNGADPAHFDHDHDGEAGGSLTKAEIVAELERRGIDHDPRAKKAELQAQLDAAD